MILCQNLKQTHSDVVLIPARTPTPQLWRAPVFQRVTVQAVKNQRLVREAMWHQRVFIVRIQATLRMWICRKRYLALKSATRCARLRSSLFLAHSRPLACFIAPRSLLWWSMSDFAAKLVDHHVHYCDQG